MHHQDPVSRCTISILFWIYHQDPFSGCTLSWTSWSSSYESILFLDVPPVRPTGLHPVRIYFHRHTISWANQSISCAGILFFGCIISWPNWFTSCESILFRIHHKLGQLVHILWEYPFLDAPLVGPTGLHPVDLPSVGTVGSHPVGVSFGRYTISWPYPKQR